MGRDKALVEVAGRTLFEYVTARVNPQFEKIYISGANNYGSSHAILPDREAGPKGPAAALYAAYHSLKDIAGFFTLPVDVPGFPDDLFIRLFSEQVSQVARDDDRLHPILGWWRMEDLYSIFENWEPGKTLSMHSLVERINAKAVLWDNSIYFQNLNTPEDVARYAQFKTSDPSL